MTTPGENQPQIESWNGRTGERWLFYQDALDRALEPLGLAAMSRAKIVTDERVLDVGCGCGATTLALAERVGPAGDVVGVDVSRPMLARARERIAAAASAKIELRQEDASRAQFPTPFDLIFSRLGVMFFDDPVQAFQHLRHAGKRLAFACWGPRSENAWAYVPAAAIAPYLAAAPPADPHAPGPFAFSDRARVTGILDAAGWREIVVEPVHLPLVWSTSPELAVAVDLFAHIGPAARTITEGTPQVREQALASLSAALAPLLGPKGLVLDGSIYLCTATA